MTMKRLSAFVLLLQVLLFVLGTIYVLKKLGDVIGAGAWFFDLGGPIAALAPYLTLPVGIIISSLLHRNGKYRASTFFPFVLLIVATAVGQLYLRIVPDPILDNFGPRPLPYSGFLFLPSEAVPAGFQEVSHNYKKQEYSIRFRKILNDDQVDLDIFESPITQFSYDHSTVVREFDHRGITGRVHSSPNGKWAKTQLTLVWLNPPRQRLTINLTQRLGDSYSPEDLIGLLQSMKVAP